MKTNLLGGASLQVTDICLGSMTWGSQNTEAEGHRQIDIALDRGVNFIDTAEMYPTTPGTIENVGDTERVIGSWFAKTGRRKDVILATKVTGIGNPRVRGGEPISGDAIRRAFEGNLERLQTDYVDLYQLHWANRGSYHMRQHWGFDPSKQARGKMDDEVLDILETIAALKAEGKIREFGLSNETVWGTSRFLTLAEQHNLPRVVSMQNEYSLICRLFDTDFAELAHHEDVPLLAWSPLAAGLLSNKFSAGQKHPGSRGDMQPTLNGRRTPASEAATAIYAELAHDLGMTPSQMAIAFCRSRPFAASTIIGATSEVQLIENLGAAAIDLTEEALDRINDIRRDFPLPI